jgi:hypothetical protein
MTQKSSWTWHAAIAALTAIAMFAAAFVLALHRDAIAAAAQRERTLIVQVFGGEGALTRARTALRAAPEVVAIYPFNPAEIAQQLESLGVDRWTALDLANLSLLKLEVRPDSKADLTARLSRRLSAAGLDAAFYGGAKPKTGAGLGWPKTGSALLIGLSAALAFAIAILGVQRAGQRPFNAIRLAESGAHPMRALAFYGFSGFAAGALAGATGVGAAIFFTLALLLTVEPSLSWLVTITDPIEDWASSPAFVLALLAAGAPLASGLLAGLGAMFGALRIYRQADRRSC